MMVYAALFHYGVCHMPAWDLGVDGYVFLDDGTVPNVVIPFAMPDKRATVF